MDQALNAPELIVSEWFNSDTEIRLADLRGQVVVLHTFQMLCPGCVLYGLPQAQKLHKLLGNQVKVIGLHTVFEHHSAMTPVSLEAFIYEYRFTFPIGVDKPNETGGTIPQTMAAYKFQGTPSLVLIDREGVIRYHWFGHIEDLAVGAAVGQLLGKTA